MSFPSSFDRSLPIRIKKYMEKHPGEIDVDIMAEDLQKVYRSDYGRRKRNAFRLLCIQVHSDILKTMGVPVANPRKKNKRKTKNNNNQNQSNSSAGEDEMDYVEYKDTNMMNESLSSMYNKEEQPTKQIELSTEPMSYDVDVAQNDEKENHKKSNFTEKNSQMKNNDDSAVQHNISVLPPVDSRSEDNSTKRRKRKEGISKKNKRLKSSKKKDDEDQDEEFSPPFDKKKFEMKKVEVTFEDFAGNEKSLEELSRLLLHMTHPEIYSTLGVTPPRGVLLHGPPGCGKTLLGNAIAGQLNLPILRLTAPELVGGVSGESEKRVREVFEMATENSPCVLFLDEIDAIAQRRENSSKEMERRIVAQLLSCMDDLNKGTHDVMVVGATNRPDTIDTSLRRAGRFDREVCLGIPDEKSRIEILKVLCRGLKLSDDVTFPLIARLTPGYVGADLLSLCREAAMHAVNRILKVNGSNQGVKESDESTIMSDEPNTKSDECKILELLKDREPFPDERLRHLSIECGDFQLAVKDVQPSAKREGFATVPDVTWDDVGALESIREELSIAILGPVRNPAAFSALGLSRASGILLAGPPGCGKTLLAKAVANQSGINFLSVKGPELLNMYVGESERAVRQCFERARNSSPCVIFFDELDSLCPRRTSSETGASARVVNQMLTELDGLESRKQVFIVGATNRPDIIDPAVLRPGRLDKTLYVGIPTNQEREKILLTITKNGTKPPLADDVDMTQIANDERCCGFTGADLSALIRESSLNALRHSLRHSWDVVLPEDESASFTKVTRQNIEDALEKVKPSISEKDRLKYEELRSKSFPT